MRSYEVEILVTVSHTVLLDAQNEDYLDDEVYDHVRHLGYDVANTSQVDFGYKILEVYRA